jgi:hypothetical protein
MGWMKERRIRIMAKAKVIPQAGSYRFVAILTWPPQADQVARQHLQDVISMQSKGIDQDNTETYYLTGARIFIIIGFTLPPGPGVDPALGLQTFISSIIYGTDIEAKVYHAVEGTEVGACLPSP